MQEIKGAGLGFRFPHKKAILSSKLPWLELLIDNFLYESGPNRRLLFELADKFPLVFHSVGLSLASPDPIARDYLKVYKELVQAIQPQYISDHLCWSQAESHYFNDLLPFPYSKKALDRVTDKVDFVQNFFGQSLLIENVSTYFDFRSSEMTEAEFLRELCERTGANILFDVNNLYVNSFNRGQDPQEFIQTIPKERIKQMHLAGHEVIDSVLVDTHGAAVTRGVWALYEYCIQQFGPVPTLIEWDSNLPNYSVLKSHQEQAQAILDSAPLSRAENAHIIPEARL